MKAALTTVENSAQSSQQRSDRLRFEKLTQLSKRFIFQEVVGLFQRYLLIGFKESNRVSDRFDESVLS